MRIEAGLVYGRDRHDRRLASQDCLRSHLRGAICDTSHIEII
jgi:hypothetical protein